LPQSYLAFFISKIFKNLLFLTGTAVKNYRSPVPFSNFEGEGGCLKDLPPLPRAHVCWKEFDTLSIPDNLHPKFRLFFSSERLC
jgi:hypothetical protein